MKKNTILLPLLCSMFFPSTQASSYWNPSSWGNPLNYFKAEPKVLPKSLSFQQKVRAIFDQNKNNPNAVMEGIKQLWDQQTDLEEDLAKDKMFNMEELKLLWEVVKYLDLPVIAATNNNVVLKFKFYKGNKLSDLTRVQYTGGRFSPDQRMQTLFMSGTFPNLESINFSGHDLSSVELAKLPNLQTLNLSGNKLKQLTLPELPQLYNLDVSNNPLFQLRLPSVSRLNDHNANLLFNNVRQVEAYYDFNQHIFEFPSAANVLRYMQTGQAVGRVLIDGNFEDNPQMMDTQNDAEMESVDVDNGQRHTPQDQVPVQENTHQDMAEEEINQQIQPPVRRAVDRAERNRIRYSNHVKAQSAKPTLNVKAMAEQRNQQQVLPFKERLRTLLNYYIEGNDASKESWLKKQIKESYDKQDELVDDLATNGMFTNEELIWLFNTAKELKLPIIAATNNHGICEFKIYKGKSIEKLTYLGMFGYGKSNDEKLRQLFISNHFSHLNTIGVSSHLLTELTLPNELPNLEMLWLDNNQLTQLTLPAKLPNLEMLWLNNNQLTQLTLPAKLPNLKDLWLDNNQLTQLTLSNELPKLEWLRLGHNQLTQLTLPAKLPNLKDLFLYGNQLTQLTLPKILPETRDHGMVWSFDPIQSVTAFYNDEQHTFQNPSKATIMDYVRTGIIDAGNRQYAIGVDVHHIGRDNKTKELAQLFEQKIIVNPAMIDGYFEDFKTYLNDLETRGGKFLKLVQKAKFTLGLSKDTNRFRPEGRYSDFGSLLGEGNEQITSCGIIMPAKEWIARLWFFASTYTDPNAKNDDQVETERENAKYSMVSSLAAAIETDGHRVCNPGKIQRLLTGVLQGRMEGANIDIPKLTNLDFFNIFKNGLNQKYGEKRANLMFSNPEEAETLDKEVMDFLTTNPNIDALELKELVDITRGLA